MSPALWLLPRDETTVNVPVHIDWQRLRAIISSRTKHHSTKRVPRKDK
jgi:hypothetical protein